MDSRTVLGLDLGSNSIGWALIEENNNQALRIIDGGVRIFIRSVEDKTPTPKNHARRKARLARRVIQRRARRKQRVQNYLISKQLLPRELADSKTPEHILNQIGNPYVLRKKALDEPIAPFELGRIILHMAARRGFQSNKKTLLGSLVDDPDVLEVLAEETLLEGDNITLSAEQVKEEKNMKAEINQLWEEIEKANARTLGEYLAGLPLNVRKRARRTERKMYQEELQHIFSEQAAVHTVVKDKHFVSEVEALLFNQRPLKLAADRLGRCSLERQRPRARKAWPAVQRFRYWQDINNLTYVNRATGEYLELNHEDKQRLAKKLEYTKEVSWAGVRKLLGFDKTVKFNLQDSKKHIKGSLTACTVRKIIGDQWDSFSEQQQNQFAEDLITISDKKALKNRLVTHWGLEIKQAIDLATTDFEPGVANLSMKATQKILPFMLQGLEYSQARIKAGYNYDAEDNEAQDLLGMPQHIPNPVVSRALNETRKVINAVIRQYGKPDAIRIEMARDIKMSKAQKDKLEKQRKRNELANERARESYKQIQRANLHLGLPQAASPTNLIKYRLWEEAEHICVYSGKSISLTQLFSADIEIDHILPFSRTLDDSFTNKVVCFAEVNRKKGNRTPYEAWGGTEQYESIKQAIRVIKSKRKRDAFYKKDLKGLDSFINSQISDTRYISREVLHYVKQLYKVNDANKAVSISKGGYTAWLRHSWGLNTVIGPDDQKNRADHRHHLVDAVVTAVVSRSLYQQIAKQAKYNADHTRIDLNTPPPWEKFREDIVDLLARVIISHAPRRRISGAFHESTAYGLQKSQIKQDQQRLVYRKALDAEFTKAKVEKVADAAIKEKLREYLEKHGGNPKIAFSEEHPFYAQKGQGKVRHVRIIASESYNPKSYLVIKDKYGKPYKYYPFGNNHHVEIYKSKEKNKKGEYKYVGDFVTTWAAAQRIRSGNSSYIKKERGDGWEFCMALCINDMVAIADENGKSFYRVQALDPSENRLKLRLHTAALIDNKKEEKLKSINVLMGELKMEKLSVGILSHSIAEV